MKYSQKQFFFIFFTSIILIIALLPRPIDARFIDGVLSRHKRVSDQRIAELEALVALAKMRGLLVTVPVGFGRVDPDKIGRRRRSSDDNKLENIRRFLHGDDRNSESIGEDIDDEKGPLLVVYNQDEENETQLN
ncbi:hypothetical protein HCN44_003696 [Aphidius gifuensis]|uniref:Uncharacterized protein n=1 Tax=Aphidius gifuensis TaxID=684658 RepID=A0A834XKD5_APHGI|nr:uncharacterized protein LOC122858771 isoform X2 [Aphidius gifuensis]KAF7987833.1 hypothetical protein HCN44_003696 [Aphidius gifuensis]